MKTYTSWLVFVVSLMLVSQVSARVAESNLPQRHILTDAKHPNGFVHPDSVFKGPRFNEGGWKYWNSNGHHLKKMKARVWADEIMGTRSALRRHDEFGNHTKGYHSKEVMLDPEQEIYVDELTREAIYDAGPCVNRLAAPIEAPVLPPPPPKAAYTPPPTPPSPPPPCGHWEQRKQIGLIPCVCYDRHGRPHNTGKFHRGVVGTYPVWVPDNAGGLYAAANRQKVVKKDVVFDSIQAELAGN